MVAEAMAWELRKDPRYIIKTFSVGETMLLSLNKKPQVIVLDFNLNSEYYDAKNALHILKEIKNIPTIILSGNKDISTAIRAIHLGACDYISKDNTNYFEEVGKSINAIVSNKLEKEEIQSLQYKTKKDYLRMSILIAFFITSIVLSLKYF